MGVSNPRRIVEEKPSSSLVVARSPSSMWVGRPPGCAIFGVNRIEVSGSFHPPDWHPVPDTPGMRSFISSTSSTWGTWSFHLPVPHWVLHVLYPIPFPFHPWALWVEQRALAVETEKKRVTGQARNRRNPQPPGLEDDPIFYNPTWFSGSMEVSEPLGGPGPSGSSNIGPLTCTAPYIPLLMLMRLRLTRGSLVL